MNCVDLGTSCYSINFRPGDGGSQSVCELLRHSTCSVGDSTLLQVDAAWNHYDRLNEASDERESVLWDTDMCRSQGKCSSDECERSLGETCLDTRQCTGHLPGPPATCDGTCSCSEAGVWTFGPNLCVPVQEWTTTGDDQWTWKLLEPSSTCQIEFDVRVVYDALVLISDSYGHVGNRWVFEIGIYTNSESKIMWHKKDGSSSELTRNGNTNVLDGNNYRTFTIQWCSGQLRAGLSGQGDFLAYNFGNMNVRYLAFRTCCNVVGQWRFHGNVRDAWYGQSASSSGRIFVIPSGEALRRRCTGNGSHIIEFEVKSPTDVIIEYRDNFAGGSDKFRVVIGSHENTRILIEVWRSGVHSLVAEGEAPDILSNSQYRPFTVSVDQNTFRLFQGVGSDKTLTIEAVIPGTQFSLNYYSLTSCCFTGNIYWNVEKYDPSWKWEEGTMWGRIEPYYRADFQADG